MDYRYNDFKNDYSEEKDVVDREDELAFLYTLNCAYKGDGYSMYVLGLMYADGGRGVDVDENKAEFWYLKGAEAGDSRAMCEIADIYSERGEYEKAVYWYSSAAETNYYAQTKLGIAYFKGLGVKANLGEAEKWLSSGAKGGYGEAYYYLAQCVKDNREKYLAALDMAVKLNYERAYPELAGYYISIGEHGLAEQVYSLAAKRGVVMPKKT